MFSQFDIESFGSFKNFEWKRAFREEGKNVVSLKRLNIIYGRNYSGKTTLSRIFRSLENGALPWNFDSARFTVRTSGAEFSQENLTNHGMKIRVYNKDFVTENLSILIDHLSGQIRTFAIVGGDNNRIAEEISALEKMLGSTESRSGERQTLAELQTAAIAARLKAQTERNALDEKLRKHANESIKKDRLVGTPNYNIEHIRQDINTVLQSNRKAIDEARRTELIALLKQDELPDIGTITSAPNDIDELRAEVSELLQRVVAPKKALPDLLANPELQAWVKSGIGHHQGVRESCAFCRQQIPTDLWQMLADHFSDSAQELERSLESCLVKISRMQERSGNRTRLVASQFYVSEVTAFNAAELEVASHYTRLSNELKEMELAIKKRAGSLFETVPMPAKTFSSSAAEASVDALRSVVAKNEARTTTLSKDKERARLELRRDNVLRFIASVDLEEKEKLISRLLSDQSAAERSASIATEKVRELERRLQALELQLKDERKGAQRVNDLLSHYFGHDGLRLEAVDGELGQGVKFLITRAGQPAFHLSEGECSLVALCYFIALLDAPESAGEDLIIYIDDPISSLDSNHIYFTYSLIEALIARPTKSDDGSNRYKYKQLFISTHNLDFLKYLKEMSMPNQKNGGTEHFMIERHGNTASKLVLMPKHLKSYVTEFNYLFHQIYLCAQPTAPGQSEEHFFSFGNNLRKFLEAYLYFKYPVKIGSEENFSRVKRFFGDDGLAAVLAGRLSNELSHLGEGFDRSVRPLDIPESRSLAAYVLDRIKQADVDQYISLLESIGADASTVRASGP